MILRLFCGCRPATAARFGLSRDGVVRVEEWPRPFLEVPLSLMSESVIAEEFGVFLDGQPAQGKWVTYEFVPEGADETNAERARCFWRWDEQPLPPVSAPAEIHRSFRALDRGILNPAPTGIAGGHTFARRVAPPGPFVVRLPPAGRRGNAHPRACGFLAELVGRLPRVGCSSPRCRTTRRGMKSASLARPWRCSRT